jgi:hypothetical protein
MSRDSRQREHVTACLCQLGKSGVPENVRLKGSNFFCAVLPRLRIGEGEGSFVLVLRRVFVEMALA